MCSSDLVVREEILARQRHELVVRRVVDDVVTDDALGRMRPVLGDVVTKVRERLARARDQHLGDTVERVAHLAEILVLRPHAAAVLTCVVMVTADLLRLHVLGIEPEHLGGLVIDPDDGVGVAHAAFLVDSGC